MSHHLRILYFSDCGPEVSAFNSQVLGMVKGWHQFATVTLFYRHLKLQPESLAGINFVPIRRFPNIARSVWSIENWVNRISERLVDFDIIHCRGPIVAWMVLKAVQKNRKFNGQILFDNRAAITEELEYISTGFWRRSTKFLRSREFMTIENLATTQSHVVSTVSTRLSNYCLEKYGRGADLIIPPVVDSESITYSDAARKKIRKQMQIGNERLFIYVTGGDQWQSVDLLLDWWPRYSSINSYDRLLICTTAPGEYSKLGKTASVKTIPADIMPTYLAAADIGILFRNETTTNRVASPIKLSEYLASGLRVVTNLPEYLSLAPERIYLIDTSSEDEISLPIENSDLRKSNSRTYSTKLGAGLAAQKIYNYISSQ